jgi:hypothetical protein
MNGSLSAIAVAGVPLGLWLLSANPARRPAAQSTAFEPVGFTVEVLIDGEEDWRRAADDGGTRYGECDVMFRYQSTGGKVVFSKSKSKIRGGWYAQLKDRFGNKPGDGGLFALRMPGIFSATPYSDSPRESLFWWRGQTRQDCNKRRRYRVQLAGKEAWNGSTRFIGVERVLYYPSKYSWTRNTNIDLGYIDLCLSDGNRCDRPYYPGGDHTPYP